MSTIGCRLFVLVLRVCAFGASKAADAKPAQSDVSTSEAPQKDIWRLSWSWTSATVLQASNNRPPDSNIDLEAKNVSAGFGMPLHRFLMSISLPAACTQEVYGVFSNDLIKEVGTLRLTFLKCSSQIWMKHDETW